MYEIAFYRHYVEQIITICIIEFENGDFTDSEKDFLKNITERYRSIELIECKFLSSSKAYTINKSVIYFYPDSIENINRHVLLHELTHIGTNCFGHTDEFWCNNKFLSELSYKYELYYPTKYEQFNLSFHNIPLEQNPMNCDDMDCKEDFNSFNHEEMEKEKQPFISYKQPKVPNRSINDTMEWHEKYTKVEKSGLEFKEKEKQQVKDDTIHIFNKHRTHDSKIIESLFGNPNKVVHYNKEKIIEVLPFLDGVQFIFMLMHLCKHSRNLMIDLSKLEYKQSSYVGICEPIFMMEPRWLLISKVFDIITIDHKYIVLGREIPIINLINSQKIVVQGVTKTNKKVLQWLFEESKNNNVIILHKAFVRLEEYQLHDFSPFTILETGLNQKYYANGIMKTCGIFEAKISLTSNQPIRTQVSVHWDMDPLTAHFESFKLLDWMNKNIYIKKMENKISSVGFRNGVLRASNGYFHNNEFISNTNILFSNNCYIDYRKYSKLMYFEQPLKNFETIFDEEQEFVIYKEFYGNYLNYYCLLFVDDKWSVFTGTDHINGSEGYSYVMHQIVEKPTYETKTISVKYYGGKCSQITFKKDAYCVGIDPFEKFDKHIIIVKKKEQEIFNEIVNLYNE